MADPALSRTSTKFAAGGLVVLIPVVLILGLSGVFDVAAAIIVAGVLIVLLMILVVDPNTIKNIRIKLTGVDMEREVATAQVAAGGVPGEEQYKPDEPIPASYGELAKLRLLLEAKLSYIAKRMDLESGEVNIGSLHYDGYLTDEEAETADRILRGTTETELAKAPADQRNAFLSAAREFVGGIRASVLAGAVRKELRAGDWTPEDVEGGKRDLLATRNGVTARIVPLFVVTPSSDLLEKVRDRVARSEGVDRRIIVVPNHSQSQTTPAQADPAVVKLNQLRDALDQAPQPSV